MGFPPIFSPADQAAFLFLQVMSNSLLSYAWQAECPSAISKLVLVNLCDHANDGGKCWPSVKRIAAQCYLSERSVYRAIRNLEKVGLVFVLRQKNAGRSQVNRYQIAHERGQPMLALVAGERVTESQGQKNGRVTESQVKGCQAVSERVTPCHPNRKEPSLNHLPLSPEAGRNLKSSIPNEAEWLAVCAAAGVPEPYAKKEFRRQSKRDDPWEGARGDLSLHALDVREWWILDGSPSQPAQPKSKTNTGSNGHAPSAYEMKIVIEAKEAEANALMNKYASTVATGIQWSDDGARKQFFTRKKEVKQLRNQLANRL